MRITEFNKQLTASMLNESVAKQFGQKLNLESFTIEQLHDARNKLRTKLSQQQIGEGFDSIHKNEDYQQAKMFLDVINLEIEGREDIVEAFTDMEMQVLQKVEEGLIDFDSLPDALQEKAKSSSQQKFMGMVYAAKKGEKPASKEVAKAASNMSKKEAEKFASTKHKNLPKHVKEGFLREGEEERAELIISAKDMVDKVTSWMEDTAQMQAEAMLDIVDAIRDEMGLDMSHEFEAIVKPALAAVYTTLESSREQLTNSVNLLTGQRSESAPEGPAQPESPDLAGGEPMAAPEAPEMGAPEAAPLEGAPEEELAGRPTRESIERGIRMSNVMSKKK
jgi:hypothetical protein